MFRLLTFLLPMLLQCIYKCTVQATIYPCDRNAPCGCSRYNVHLNSAIIGSESAAGHSWGWAVSLRVTNGEMHFCSGVILSEYYILTAAHCVNHPEIRDFPLEIAFGIDTLVEESGERRIISDIILHPDWTSKTNENDIAILRIDKPINFTNKNNAKICLPSINPFEAADYPSADTTLVAIGWGYTMFDDIESDFLQQMRLIVLDKQTSQQMSKDFNPYLQFCAMTRGDGTDIHSGDSGGPIMHYSEHHQQWTIAGITSFGNSCGTTPQVGVYTRVSVYIDWIRSIAGERNTVFLGQHRQTSDTSRTSRLIDDNAVNSSVMSRSRTLASLIFVFLLFSIFIIVYIYQ